MIINQINTSNWDYQLIDEKFDIFKLSAENFNRNILDIQDEKLKFVSTFYMYGDKAFCMTVKNTFTNETIKDCILEKFPELNSDQLKVEKIQLLMLSLFGEHRILKAFDYKKQALLQLLINSTLNNPVFEEDAYNNITGKCYFYNKLWNDCPNEKIELVDFTLDNKMTLYPTVATFIKEKPKKPAYQIVYDNTRNIVRKAMPGDKEETIYYRKGIYGTHAVRHAIGTTLKEWETSRMACLATFYATIKEELNEYVTIDFKKIETENIKVQSLDVGYDVINEVHRSNGITMVNHIAFSQKEKERANVFAAKTVKWINECRNNLIIAFKNYCKSNNIIFKISSTRDIYRSNLCLVRDKDFYKNNETMEDLHFADKNCICQHITLPFSKGGFDEMVNVVLKEMVVKSDLMERKIRLADWSSFGFDKIMNFYISKTTRDKDNEITSLNIVGMTIQMDGSFTTSQYYIPNIEEFDSQQYNNDDQNIIDCFRSDGSEGKYFDRDIEMAIWSENNVLDAYIIKRTNIRAISNIEEMKRNFDDEKADTTYDTDTILDAIKEFQYCGNSRHEEVAKNIYTALMEKETITKKELIPLLYPTKKEGQKTNPIDTIVKEAISNATGSILRVSRTNENETKMGLDVYKHIHLWYNVEEEYTNWEIPTYCYTVGMVDKPKQKIANSPVVRKILRKNGFYPDREFVDKIITMLQVGFVKFKNYTVLPFPAKYLRELMAY